KALFGLANPVPVELAVLNSPKPSQYQFYTGDMEQRPWNSGNRKTHRLDNERQAFDARASRLRGRKVYMTHRDIL
ncbi:hypothetical protein, partial [Kocuria sp.]|uniref:hypothetical protein n=1 Tax=Kocuria sp. TaxID=1871328 RepID=UPI0026DF88CD